MSIGVAKYSSYMYQNCIVIIIWISILKTVHILDTSRLHVFKGLFVFDIIQVFVACKNHHNYLKLAQYEFGYQDGMNLNNYLVYKDSLINIDWYNDVDTSQVGSLIPYLNCVLISHIHLCTSPTFVSSRTSKFLMCSLGILNSCRDQHRGPTLAVLECPLLEPITGLVPAFSELPCIQVPCNARDSAYQVIKFHNFVG